MFVRIGDFRIKISSIQEYKKGTYSPSTNNHYLVIKVSGKERMIAYGTEVELEQMLKYLDSVLKVQEA